MVVHDPPEVEARVRFPVCSFGSRKVERSIRPENFGFRYGVVGNMSGSHPVASGSIPGIGWLVLLAQLAEHPLNMMAFLAQSVEHCANNFSKTIV